MTTTAHYTDEHVRLHHDDCRTVIAGLPDESVDAVVTDPPYELAFMGRRWDATGIAYEVALWRDVLRVLKPGGHLLAFGGTRTWHRLACAIEDAGFEVRDSIAWMYGSGFPKSLDVSKAIDKAAGAEGTYGAPKSAAHAGWIDRGRMRGDDGHEGFQRPWMQDENAVDKAARQYAPATPDAAKWQGWGTALKPAHEPIVVARKPLIGTVAENVLRHGTGAINVDGGRIGTDAGWSYPNGRGGSGWHGRESLAKNLDEPMTASAGRWPANVILDESQAAELDRQSGVQRDGVAVRRNGVKAGMYGPDLAVGSDDLGYGGEGGASRFFYVPKADSSERPRVDGIAHPTVKPVDLMRYLVRLVTPPGGVVLEPFAGSGTTLEACIVEGFRCIGIEREADYLPLIMARITKPIEPVMF